MKRLACLAVAFATLDSPARAGRLTPVAEAQTFMADYARDILNGNRTALAERYDPGGAFLLVTGNLEFAQHHRIVDDYAKRWSPPLSFEWRDLHFAAAGSDVVVNGRFVWGGANGPRTFTYTGFLRRRDGRLLIRLEDEMPIPTPGT